MSQDDIEEFISVVVEDILEAIEEKSFTLIQTLDGNDVFCFITDFDGEWLRLQSYTSVHNEEDIKPTKNNLSFQLVGNIIYDVEHMFEDARGFTAYKNHLLEKDKKPKRKSRKKEKIERVR